MDGVMDRLHSLDGYDTTCPRYHDNRMTGGNKGRGSGENPEKVQEIILGRSCLDVIQQALVSNKSRYTLQGKHVIDAYCLTTTLT